MASNKTIVHLSKDKVLNRVIKTTDILKLANSGNVFNELVKAIVYQQISYKAADSIYNKFTTYLGSKEYKPQHIIKSEHDSLRATGLSGQKAAYVKNIAMFFEENKLLDTDWDQYSDEEIMNLLTQIKGVGEWTVQMILIFELLREDVFPMKDLAIQQVMTQLYDLKFEKKELFQKMHSIAESWRPYRSYASLYLWAWKRENY